MSGASMPTDVVRAKRLLAQLSSELGSLKLLDYDEAADKFEVWLMEAESAISTVFGTQSRQLNNFRRATTPVSSFSYIASDDERRRHIVKYHGRQVDGAERVMKAIIYEVDNLVAPEDNRYKRTSLIFWCEFLWLRIVIPLWSWIRTHILLSIMTSLIVATIVAIIERTSWFVGS